MAWFSAKLSEVKTGKKTETVADLTIDKAIGSDWSPDWFADLTGEQSARNFIDSIEALGDFDRIRLTLNSPGGDVASGIRIYNYLKNRPENVEIRVEGMAASIASVILMAGDSRVMGVGSTVMIHNPMTYAGGMYNEAELREMADAMAVIKSGLVAAYVDGTGKSAEEISALMDEGDSYFDSAMAIDYGFATSTDESLRAVASLDMGVFRNQIATAGKIKELEASNAELLEMVNERDDRNFEAKKEIEDLTDKLGHSATAVAGLEEVIADLRSEVDGLMNPPAASAEDIIAWTDEAGIPELAVKFVKDKLPEAVAKERIALAASLNDIAAAAGIPAGDLIANIESPSSLVKSALAAAKAVSQGDIAGQVAPTKGTNGPNLMAVYSQLNRN